MTNRHMRVCSTLLIIRENANQNHNEAIIKNKIAVRLLLKKKKKKTSVNRMWGKENTGIYW